MTFKDISKFVILLIGKNKNIVCQKLPWCSMLLVLLDLIWTDKFHIWGRDPYKLTSFWLVGCLLKCCLFVGVENTNGLKGR